MDIYPNTTSIPQLHACMRWAVCVCAAVWCVVLVQSAHVTAQEVTHVQGVIFFKDIPSGALDPTGSTSMWRVDTPLAVPQRSPLNLAQMRLVLVADDPSVKSFDPPAEELEVSGYAIHPMSFIYPTGTTIRFINKGPTSYTLRVAGRRSIEPLVLEDVGSQASVLLSKPGRYVLQDVHNASTIAYIVATRATKTAGLIPTDKPNEATFDFGLVPQGSYTLNVYMRGKVVHSQEVKANKAKLPTRFLLTGEELQKALSE